jgi:DNA polymerase III subunit chi
MEVFFYHLERRGLEDTLPELLERTLARGWRALVRTGSVERAQALDAHLWTYSEESFLPHGLASDRAPELQPILLGSGAPRANAAEAVFLVDGADPGDWAALSAEGFTRAVLLFDGRDADAVAAAREHWKTAKAAGLDSQYWQQSAAGKWEKKA